MTTPKSDATSAEAAQQSAGEVAQAGRLSPWEIPLAVVSCGAMLFIVGLTFIEVFNRYLFARPIRGASEMIQVAMALLIFAAMPLVTARRGHVTVSLIDGALKGAMRRLVNWAVDLISIAACSIIAWRLFVHAGSLSEINETTVVLQMPTAPMVYAMSALAAITVVAQVVLLLKGTRT